MPAQGERMMHMDEHEMVAARCEGNMLMRFDRERLQRLHRHAFGAYSHA